MATKATETKTESTRGRQLQATVSQDIYDAYEEFHWEARKNTVDIVRDALVDYGVAKGFLTVNEDGDAVPTPKA
jgi:hypothetical protein